MNDYYDDTDRRMMYDADFRSAVHVLMQMAQKHGFTPGELKQIAFRAAYELELRRPPNPLYFSQQPRSEHLDDETGEV